MRNFYEYYEECAIGSNTGMRKKKVAAVKDPRSIYANGWESSLFTWAYGYTLEGREHVAQSEGCWPATNHRIMRRIGDPGKVAWPYIDRQYPPPINPESVAKAERVHHYFRCHSAQNCKHILKSQNACSLSIELTEDWHSPSKGIINQIDPNSPILNSHCVCLSDYDDKLKMFHFPNSWGDKWGNNGYGMISPEVIDNYIIECWAFVGVGLFPPLHSKAGDVLLKWKCALGGKEVHGREIVNADTKDRLGWCFMSRRGNYLDIEELYVWPKDRNRGIGRMLAKSAIELSSAMKLPLRALVGFSDIDNGNIANLNHAMRLLDLNLHPSPERSIAFYGLSEICNSALSSPRVPIRPAGIRDSLESVRKQHHAATRYMNGGSV